MMKNYFSGYYFKCQSSKNTIAFIVACHQSAHKKTCSIQFITDEQSWHVDFPFASFQKQKNTLHITIDNNILGEQGIEINLKNSDLAIEGSLTYSNLSPLKYNIMGPFQYIPFMQCQHDIISMKHYVNGTLYINNKKYIFKNDLGYIEGDHGSSFPRQYVWTQCFFKEGSLMLSVADIPFGLFHFTGIIGIVLFNDREYRFATYLGAKMIKKENHEIIVKQKNMLFKAKLIKRNDHPLLAPSKGEMVRTIHESVTCLASYEFIKDHHTIFSFESPNASFEYEY